MRKLLKKQGLAPKLLVTDKLGSYGSAFRQLRLTRPRAGSASAGSFGIRCATNSISAVGMLYRIPRETSGSNSRLLQDEMVTRIYNCVELIRHAGTLLLLKDDGRPGAKGRQSGRQRPIGEVDRANQIGLPRAGKCGSSIPSSGSAIEAFCQVKYFSPRSWQLTFASDFAEFARDFSVGIAADWSSALLPIVHIFDLYSARNKSQHRPIKPVPLPLEAASSYPPSPSWSPPPWSMAREG